MKISEIDQYRYFAPLEIADGVAYRLAGSTDKPALVLGNSLGTDSRLWTQQVAALKNEYRILCFEYPGHGSPSWVSCLDMASYAKKLGCLLDHLGINTYSYCGLSMGGAIGMELALLHGARMSKLVLSNTAAEFGQMEFWKSRIDTALRLGISALADNTIARWFTAEFAAENEETVQIARAMLMNTQAEGYAECCRVIAGFKFDEKLAYIRQPTLVVAGLHDLATTTEQSRKLAACIPNAEYRDIDAAHLGNLGAPDQFIDIVGSFLRKDQ